MQALITTQEIPITIQDATREKRRLQPILDAQSQKQEQIEAKLWKLNRCPAKTLDYLRDHIGTFDTEQLLRYLREKFYNRDVMRAIRCTMESIFSPVDDGGLQDNERIRYWIEPIERIGAESVFGYAIRSNVGEQGENVLVLKAPRMQDVESLVHEYVVGVYGTNMLRGIVPNFAYVFGTFDCSAPILFNNGQVSTWCNEETNSVGYVSYENITPSITLGKYVETCSFGEFLNMYLQVLYAIRKAHQLIDFTHYDLHAQNVLVRDISNIFPDGCIIPYDTEYGTEYLFANKIATIIDFGQAHIKIQGESFGYYGLEQYGNIASQSFPLYDAYKLLLMSMRSMLQANNKKCFDGAARILRFFNNAEDPAYIVKEQSKYVYILPRTPRTLSVSLDDLLGYIRYTFSPAFVAQVIPRNKILICEEDQCRTEERVLTELGFNKQVNAKSIPEFYDLHDRYIQTNNMQDAEIIKQNFNYKQESAKTISDIDTKIGALEADIQKFQPLDISTFQIEDRNNARFIQNLRANVARQDIVNALVGINPQYRRIDDRQLNNLIADMDQQQLNRFIEILQMRGIQIYAPVTLTTPQVVEQHKENFDSYAHLVDRYQNLTVLNRALAATADVYADRKTQSISRQYAQDLQLISGQLRSIWNQYQQQLQIVRRFRDINWYSKGFAQALATMSAVLS